MQSQFNGLAVAEVMSKNSIMCPDNRVKITPDVKKTS
jgi:hypothetical protein